MIIIIKHSLHFNFPGNNERKALAIGCGMHRERNSTVESDCSDGSLVAIKLVS